METLEKVTQSVENRFRRQTPQHVRICKVDDMVHIDFSYSPTKEGKEYLQSLASYHKLAVSSATGPDDVFYLRYTFGALPAGPEEEETA